MTEQEMHAEFTRLKAVEVSVSIRSAICDVALRLLSQQEYLTHEQAINAANEMWKAAGAE